MVHESKAPILIGLAGLDLDILVSYSYGKKESSLIDNAILPQSRFVGTISFLGVKVHKLLP